MNPQNDGNAKSPAAPVKLLPCPFCGGRAEYNDFNADHYGLDRPGVECPDCRVRNFAFSKEEAILKWNTRF